MTWAPAACASASFVGVTGASNCATRCNSIATSTRTPKNLPRRRSSASSYSGWRARGRFEGDEVSLVLAPPEVKFFPLRIPDQALSQPVERIEQALRWEVAQESRASVDELEVRHWRLPASRVLDANVMAVSIPTRRVIEWSDALAHEGLTLRRIDVAPCALVRLSRALWTPAPDELWGVLDLGLRHATLTVVVGTVPTYIRTFGIGSDRWTRQVAKAFEVTYPIAEQLKREHGVRAPARGLRVEAGGGGLAQTSDLGSAMSAVLRDAVQQLTGEISRCFSYMMRSFPEHALQRLMLTGGGAMLPGLSEALGGDLGIAVDRLTTDDAQPRANWEQLPERVQVTPHAATVLGGALLDLETS